MILFAFVWGLDRDRGCARSRIAVGWGGNESAGQADSHTRHERAAISARETVSALRLLNPELCVAWLRLSERQTCDRPGKQIGSPAGAAIRGLWGTAGMHSTAPAKSQSWAAGYLSFPDCSPQDKAFCLGETTKLQNGRSATAH